MLQVTASKLIIEKNGYIFCTLNFFKIFLFIEIYYCIPFSIRLEECKNNNREKYQTTVILTLFHQLNCNKYKRFQAHQR